jgi:uncharacterized protein YdhG (YjbR/CyaY superfamily)
MKSVQDFIAALPRDEKIIVSRLRSLILDIDPRIQEKLSYGVPYFFHHRRICFLWPASAIPYETGKAKERTSLVDFGLCYGNELSNEQGLLLAEGRKQVYVIRLSSASEINEQAFREIIMEAVLVDDGFKKKRKINKR